MTSGGNLPSGTVTFLFTDVEGSTRSWAADADAMSASLRVHDAIVRDAIEANAGYVFTTAGDSFAAAFTRASDAVNAATAAQVALDAATWPGPALKIRIGIHQGESEERQGDYFGPVVNIAARVEAAGHGGQTLMSESVRTAAAVADATDLGVHRLRDVDEPLCLFQLGDHEFPPLRAASNTPPSNLPVRPTRLIGRDAEVALVRQHLATNRLVTIAAVGGSGKTRLANAVGEQELDHRPGGVWFVDLTTVMSESDVPAAIAAAVGLTLASGEIGHQVIQFLADKTALVILDNCEHLVDACAEFAERFLARAGDAAILATSREALDVDGERVFQLGSLAVADAESIAASPAVRLFSERAMAVDPVFTLDDANLATIATVCERLDGMPLAIELAAARITVMTPAELLAGLDDRFQLLSGGRRRQRQRTLEATLDWSYNLLEPDQQRVFRSLGVFVGGFDVDAVAEVAEITRAAALDTIEALIAKSLVTRANTTAITTRFAMLETLKAYAEDRLVQSDDAATIRDRHANHFHELAMRGGRVLSPDARLGAQVQWDRGNITTAIEWALTKHDVVLAGELLLGGYAAYSGYGHAAEAFALYERCITPLAAADRELADFLGCASLFSLMVIEEWTAWFDVAFQLHGSPDPRVRCAADASAAVPMALYSSETVAELHTTAAADLALARTAGPDINTALAESMLCWSRAVSLAYSRDYRAALEAARDGLEDPSNRDRDRGFAFEIMADSDFAVFEILSGEPETALLSLAALDRARYAYENGEPDEIRALAHLALGDVATAVEHIRLHAARALTGTRIRERNDGVLLLAALAHTEGDDDTARALLLNTGLALTCGTVAFARELAVRLGIAEEYRAHEIDAMNPFTTLGPLGTTNATATLRRELARRGWL